MEAAARGYITEQSRETVGDRQCLRLACDLDSQKGTLYTTWFDEETLLPLRSEISVDGAVVYEVAWSRFEVTEAAPGGEDPGQTARRLTRPSLRRRMREVRPRRETLPRYSNRKTGGRERLLPLPAASAGGRRESAIRRAGGPARKEEPHHAYEGPSAHGGAVSAP